MDNYTLYTDGNGVKITSSAFYVRKQEYALEAIEEIKLLKLPSRKAPGIALFVAGFCLMFIGSIDIFTTTANYPDGDLIAISVGVVLVIAAIIAAVMSKSKYAIKITTNMGERRPIESKNKEYVTNVVSSLKRAYYRYIKRKERRK